MSCVFSSPLSPASAPPSLPTLTSNSTAQTHATYTLRVGAPVQRRNLVAARPVATMARLSLLLAAFAAAAAAPLALVWAQVVDADIQACDRECRWHFGFYDRRITGVRVDESGHNDTLLGRFCNCFDAAGQPLAAQPVPRESVKQWDDADFWCGPGGNGTGAGFNTTFVCALAGPDAVVTRTRAEAAAQQLPVVHCGRCAACSHPADVRVLYDTRHFITTAMTRCAAKFAEPSFMGGDKDLGKLRACLVAANITFDQTRRLNVSGNVGAGPTCMDCWTDDIMCDSTQCNTDPACIEKFINPNNTGSFAGCLECDETHCGAEFMKCAGANRRSSGILSDIARPSSEVCPVGFYANCSHCHSACGTADPACNAKCEQLPSCKGPQ